MGGTFMVERCAAASTRPVAERDRKSTRLNSSHSQISYAVFCLKKKKKHSALRFFCYDDTVVHRVPLYMHRPVHDDTDCGQLVSRILMFGEVVISFNSIGTPVVC